jgi:hypothetical protein
MPATAKLVSFSGWNILLLSHTSDVDTVLCSGRSAVVSSGQDLIVPDDDGTDIAA